MRLAHGWRFKHEAVEAAGPCRRRVIRYRSYSAPVPINVCFSNRPFRVKHFQTIRRCSVDVAHGLALLFGNWAPRPFHYGILRMRWSNLCSGLAVRHRTVTSRWSSSRRPGSRTSVPGGRPWHLPFLMPGLTIWQRGSYLARSDCVIFQAGSHRARRPECRAHYASGS